MRRLYNFCNRHWSLLLVWLCLASLGCCMLLLGGCVEREQSTTAGTLRGTFNGQPVQVELDLSGSAQRQVGPDPVLIEEAAKRAAAAVAAQVPGLESIRALIAPMKKEEGPDGTLIGTGVAAGTASLWALFQTLTARAHKKDSDEAWDRLAPPKA
jgi:hypothetical protein